MGMQVHLMSRQDKREQTHGIQTLFRTLVIFSKKKKRRRREWLVWGKNRKTDYVPCWTD